MHHTEHTALTCAVKHTWTSLHTCVLNCEVTTARLVSKSQTDIKRHICRSLGSMCCTV